MTGDLNKFISRMIYWCRDVSLGYDQSNRQDFRHKGETDCSALVIHALKEAGFDAGNATYTGNMRSILTARGWTVVANDGVPQKGDILLNDVSHVAVYIGNGQLAQASIDERGKITGGQGGDQSGRETNISNYYNYPWNCYLRYTGSGGNTSEGQIAKIQEWLNSNYQSGLAVDDSGGPATRKAIVKAVQKEMNKQYNAELKLDGSFGPASQKAWLPFNEGANGNITRLIQAMLYVKGYDPNGFDGSFGPGCTAAIKAYQKNNKLAVDGWAGPTTASSLFN